MVCTTLTISLAVTVTDITAIQDTDKTPDAQGKYKNNITVYLTGTGTVKVYHIPDGSTTKYLMKEAVMSSPSYYFYWYLHPGKYNICAEVI